MSQVSETSTFQQESMQEKKKVRIIPVKSESDQVQPPTTVSHAPTETMPSDQDNDEEEEEDDPTYPSSQVSHYVFRNKLRKPITKRPRVDNIDLSVIATRALSFKKWDQQAVTVRSKCAIDRMLRTIHTCANSILDSTGENDTMFGWDVEALTTTARMQYFSALQDQIQRMAEIMNSEVSKCERELGYISNSTALEEWV